MTNVELTVGMIGKETAERTAEKIVVLVIDVTAEITTTDKLFCWDDSDG